MINIENKYFAGIAIFTLYIAFIIISFLVIISNKNPFFIKYKLKLGAFIITLNAVIFGNAQDEIAIMCYEISSVNNISFVGKEVVGDKIIIKKGFDKSFSGYIYAREGEAFSYIIIKSDKSLVSRGIINAKDRRFNEFDEKIELKISEELPTGKYELRLYDVEVDSIINRDHYIKSYKLIVKD